MWGFHIKVSLCQHLKLLVQFLDVLLRGAWSHNQVRITELVKGFLQVCLLVRLGGALAPTHYPLVLLLVKLKTFEYGCVGQCAILDDDEELPDACLLSFAQLQWSFLFKKSVEFIHRHHSLLLWVGVEKDLA